MIFCDILLGYIYYSNSFICVSPHMSVELFHNESWTRFDFDDPTS